MCKKLLVASLLSFVFLGANADTLSDQMQQLNDIGARNETNLWLRMRDGFQLDHKETKEVKYWEKRYGNPKYFNIIMQNAAPYLYFVVTEMERRGIPTELALIPIVESTYNPNAVSPAAISTGMWQFVSSSGKRFGLTQNSDLDERKDIIKSTRAAIIYLQYLHDMFGSWELAIAAYNWGEGNINNAVINAGSKNFYDLDVRDVTHQYVPKVIALANIIQNPGKFGIKLTDLNNSPYFAIVQPDAPLMVSNFMTMANLSPTLFKKLNPQFNSETYIASPAQRLLLPVTNQPTYLASLRTNGAQSPVAGTVVATTTTTTSSLAASADNDPINQLASGNDQNITNPVNNTGDQVAFKDNTSVDINANNPTAATTSTTSTANQGGATSSATTSQIKDLLADTGVTATAAVTAGTAVKPAIQSKQVFISYIVAPGDTLFSIAKKFAVPIDSIKADNNLVDNTVKLNQKLIIRTPVQPT